MTASYERAFRIRYDECDAYGHVNHANYLRYMQEAAFDASAELGYGFAAYKAMNRHWLVRETDITFLKPLTYGDTVVVKTWVADFRRVLSHRIYELYLKGTAELVATAYTDWVYLDASSHHPADIPAQMVKAFMPDGPPAHRIERERFPRPPAPPSGVFRTMRRVEWHEIDSAKHVNNANYVAYLEDCGIEFARQNGWPVGRMMSEGFGIVARRFRIQYKQPALMDDDLQIATWVSDVKRATAVRHYTICRSSDTKLLARARALWVWIDLETRRPIRIPFDFKEDMSGNAVQDHA